MLRVKRTEAFCFSHTAVIDGVFDSLKLCSVFQIKDGLGFACFSIFMCCICVANSSYFGPVNNNIYRHN